MKQILVSKGVLLHTIAILININRVVCSLAFYYLLNLDHITRCVRTAGPWCHYDDLCSNGVSHPFQ